MYTSGASEPRFAKKTWRRCREHVVVVLTRMMRVYRERFVLTNCVAKRILINFLTETSPKPQEHERAATLQRESSHDGQRAASRDVSDGRASRDQGAVSVEARTLRQLRLPCLGPCETRKACAVRTSPLA